VGWGLIGMLVGLLCALQLSFPALNFDIPWLTFSRLRRCTPTRSSSRSSAT
jgi:cytochrome c oxidase cbb3-type subunit 1